MDWRSVGISAVLGFSAIGSSMGAGAAGMAAIGAWKKCYTQGRQAPFMLIAFVGAPLTQTIYGYIILNTLLNAAENGGRDPFLILGTGVFSGIAVGVSALYQGKVGACACDALGETGKGFASYFLAIGLLETVALFVMVFSIIVFSR